MDTLEFNYFLQRLKDGRLVDEISFYFDDDKQAFEHYIGFAPRFEFPYWIGLCDIDDGTEFKTAEDLVNAPVYGGRSLKEHWSHVRLISLAGICLDDWIELFHEDDST